MIIDAHTHAWPDAVAARALAGTLPDLTVFGDGTVAGLTRSMEAAGIDQSIVLGVANTADRVPNANRFVGGLDRTRFIPFGSLHAGVDPGELAEDLARHDLPGVKIHPLFQDYTLDDERLDGHFDMLSETGRACIMHVGGGSDEPRCTPRMLVDIVRRFPRLKLVACHFGGYRMYQEALEVVAGHPVHVDTSWPPSLLRLGAQRVRRLIERHDPERVVFASDWPMADVATELEFVASLGFDEATTAGILGGNIRRLLDDVATTTS